MTMNNEEFETTEEREDTNSGFGWKLIGGALATAGVIWGGLKLRKKFKAKKESSEDTTETVENETVEVTDVEDKKQTGKKKK